MEARHRRKGQSIIAMLECSIYTGASLPKKSWVAVGRSFFTQVMLNGQL